MDFSVKNSAISAFHELLPNFQFFYFVHFIVSDELLKSPTTARERRIDPIAGLDWRHDQARNDIPSLQSIPALISNQSRPELYQTLVFSCQLNKRSHMHTPQPRYFEEYPKS